MSTTTTLPYPPINVPFVDEKRVLTSQWAMWFQQLYVRVGGAVTVDPTIPSQGLVSTYPLTLYIVPSGQTINFNGVNYTSGQVIPFYTSPSGVNTVIDSLVVKNITAFPVNLTVYSVPYNNLPSSSNALVTNLSIAPNSGNVTISQLANVELGSGAYLVVVVSQPQSMICTVSGRLVT